MNSSDARDPQGRLRIVVSESRDTTALRWAGDLLERKAGARSADRFHAPDQKFWDYDVRGRPITLHWHQAEGLWLNAGDTELGTERQTRELADMLREELARLDLVD